MARGRTDGGDRHVGWHAEAAEERREIGLGAAGGDEDQCGAPRRGLPLTRTPFHERHLKLLRQQRPEVAEGVRQPHNQQRDIGHRHQEWWLELYETVMKDRCLMSRPGIEPGTYGLKVRCSTN